MSVLSMVYYGMLTGSAEFCTM